MKTKHTLPWLTASVCLASLLVAAAGPRVSDILILSRDSGPAALLPRLWTTHLVHVSAWHLWLNVLAAGLALGWLELYSRKTLLRVLLVAGPVCGLATLLAHPSLQAVCGLSGLLHAAAGALCAGGLLRGHRLLPVTGLVLAAGKVALEFVRSDSLFLSSLPPGAMPVPFEHATGLVCGFLVALATFPRTVATASLHRSPSSASHP